MRGEVYDIVIWEAGWSRVSASDIGFKIPIPDVRNTFILICRVLALLKLM
jgi:hypothetical protein